jgi:hypothetical protein
MNHIGGFFEQETIEDSYFSSGSFYPLSTGRACLALMLTTVRPKHVYVPFYTCDATLEPFRQLGVRTTYYAIDYNLEPQSLPSLQDGELFLWTNYFGLKQQYTQYLLEHFGPDKLILDDTHNLFGFEYSECWSFTSLRKYFGVGDGALLFSPKELDLSKYSFFNSSNQHCKLRLAGKQNEAFKLYQSYEASLDCSIHRMSKATESNLKSLDLYRVMKKRLANFTYLSSLLDEYNQLKLTKSCISPFCYPLLPASKIELTQFHQQGIYIPKLWEDVCNRELNGFECENDLAARLLPLPIDHRYDREHMQLMADMLIPLLKNMER